MYDRHSVNRQLQINWHLIRRGKIRGLEPMKTNPLQSACTFNLQIQDLRRPFDGLPRGFSRFECYRSDKNRKNDEGKRNEMMSAH